MLSQRPLLNAHLAGLLPLFHMCVAGYQTPLETEIIAAVKQAYSLEEQLFAAREQYTSWEDVYRHYRRGFGEEIARRLADYSWWPEGDELRGGDRSMAVPDTVLLLEVSDAYAVVVHPTPDWLQELWGRDKYTVDRLQRDNDRWVIVESRSISEIPLEHDSRPPSKRSQRAPPQEFNYDRDLGLAAVDRTGLLCVTIKAEGLGPGGRVTLVWVPTGGSSWKPQVTEAEIRSRRERPCDMPGGTEPDDLAYEAGAIDSLMYASAPYFAGLFRPSNLVIDEQRVRGDLDGDGITEEFRACTSHEGLHMSIWTGEPLEGERRWRRYYYLGYDVEPSCEDRDFGS